MVAGFGACGGIWAALSNLAFIRFFGRQHLGQISGLSMSLVVFGSAIGPALFSIGYDLFGTYHAAVWLSLTILAVLLTAAVIIHNRNPSPWSVPKSPQSIFKFGTPINFDWFELGHP